MQQPPESSAPAVDAKPKIDATWDSQPPTGEWNQATNWRGDRVATDTATFGPTSRTAIDFSSKQFATVERIVFSADAPPYTFAFRAPAPNAPALTITGQGVANHSVHVQAFVVASSAVGHEDAQLKFTNSATAGGATVHYTAGPATPQAPGGGVISFCNQSTAGSALFTVTTGAGTPVEPSTVGGEVSFSDSSSAGAAQFTVYGSTSTTDGDTFGNVVFHDTSTSANGVFTNAGGTLMGGDGGNTQFYDNATAASGLFHNMGATAKGANGGDVAIDGTATAGEGSFHNYAAAADGGYGGVTSFNNNLPDVNRPGQGASAGSGQFYNYGAKAEGQGGGHTYFTAKYGSPSAAGGTFVNYGSALAGINSTAGHTVFSISVPQKIAYVPDAGEGVFWNLPGTAAAAPGGYTEFTVYADEKDVNAAADIAASHGPTARNGTFMNMGGVSAGACGGQMWFCETSTAENAELIATGGVNGGLGGAVVFRDQASGGSATVRLGGNGTLDLSGYAGSRLTIAHLELAPGCIAITLGAHTPCLNVAEALAIAGGPVAFVFASGQGFATGTAYTIFTAPNLAEFPADQFTGNQLNGASPEFRIAGNDLQVTFR